MQWQCHFKQSRIMRPVISSKQVDSDPPKNSSPHGKNEQSAQSILRVPIRPTSWHKSFIFPLRYKFAFYGYVDLELTYQASQKGAGLRVTSQSLGGVAIEFSIATRITT